MMMILHITTRAAWETAGASYIPDNFSADGFIHCSTIEQVLLSANEIFHGRTDLLLLCIDEEKVQAPVIYEDCYDTGRRYPHIYGPLNKDAIVRIVNFPANEDGSFSLPPPLNLP